MSYGGRLARFIEYHPMNQDHRHRLPAALILASVLSFPATVSAALVTVEAESGVLGTNFLTGTSGGVIYISNTNNNSASTPGIPGRVASYTVTFPTAGTYDLYARVL